MYQLAKFSADAVIAFRFYAMRFIRRPNADSDCHSGVAFFGLNAIFIADFHQLIAVIGQTGNLPRRLLLPLEDVRP